LFLRKFSLTEITTAKDAQMQPHTKVLHNKSGCNHPHQHAIVGRQIDQQCSIAVLYLKLWIFYRILPIDLSNYCEVETCTQSNTPDSSGSLCKCIRCDGCKMGGPWYYRISKIHYWQCCYNSEFLSHVIFSMFCLNNSLAQCSSDHQHYQSVEAALIFRTGRYFKSTNIICVLDIRYDFMHKKKQTLPPDS
jgi:hypothetical protein